MTPGPHGCVLYWMQAAQRAEGNPALNAAVRRANALGLPAAAFFGLDAAYPNANARHFAFMLDGLRETEADLEAAGIPLVLRLCSPARGVVQAARELGAVEVFTEEAVLRAPRAWRAEARAALGVPLTEVPSETVVPVDAFGRLAGNAATLRRFLQPRIAAMEDEAPRPAVERPWRPEPLGIRLAETSTDALLDAFRADRSVSPAPRFPPGPRAARAALRRFVAERLERYGDDRNAPERSATSELSPYLHFGHIGPHTIARAVREADAPEPQKAAFLEQLIVRRELAWNHARFNPDYDRYEGLPAWGRATLADHAADPRPVLYTRDQFERAETHSATWNAAQREMVETGYMHGYRRMGWAKKILEWSATPQEAFETAVYLNDKYELDGRDPNGYAGIAWSIGGRHDRPWFRRPIFGLIRYMKG